MEILLPAERIQTRVAEMARRITSDYAGRPVTIVGVLTGCLMFLADLVRHLDLPLRISLIKASSYRGESTEPGQLAIHPDLLSDIRDRHVLLLDDILDTGHTLARLIAFVGQQGPASIRTAVFVRKKGRQQMALEPDYCGFEIPNLFVVGYGMDYNDDYRHLPYLAVLPQTDSPQLPS
jgi:hypoxanthine phosphoribosyltransferase